MSRRKSRVSSEEFVRIWQNAKSLSEVADLCGMTKRAASVRATYYRARQIDLKEFDGSLDVGALSAIAKRHAPKGAK